MADPAWYSNNASMTMSASAISLAPPSHAAGQLLILAVSTAKQNITTPSNWTLIGYVDSGTGSAGTAQAVRTYLFWKFGRGSGTEPNISINDSGSYQAAYCWSIVNHSTDNPPILYNSNGYGNWGSTDLTGHLIILVLGLDYDGTSTNQVTQYSNSSLTSITEHLDRTTNTGAGGGLAIFSGLVANSEVGSWSLTLAQPSLPYTVQSIAIKPEVTGNTYNDSVSEGVGTLGSSHPAIQSSNASRTESTGTIAEVPDRLISADRNSTETIGSIGESGIAPAIVYGEEEEPSGTIDSVGSTTFSTSALYSSPQFILTETSSNNKSVVSSNIELFGTLTENQQGFSSLIAQQSESHNLIENNFATFSIFSFLSDTLATINSNENATYDILSESVESIGSSDEVEIALTSFETSLTEPVGMTNDIKSALSNLLASITEFGILLTDTPLVIANLLASKDESFQIQDIEVSILNTLVSITESILANDSEAGTLEALGFTSESFSNQEDLLAETLGNLASAIVESFYALDIQTLLVTFVTSQTEIYSVESSQASSLITSASTPENFLLDVSIIAGSYYGSSIAEPLSIAENSLTISGSNDAISESILLQASELSASSLSASISSTFSFNDTLSGLADYQVSISDSLVISSLEDFLDLGLYMSIDEQSEVSDLLSCITIYNIGAQELLGAFITPLYSFGEISIEMDTNNIEVSIDASEISISMESDIEIQLDNSDIEVEMTNE